MALVLASDSLSGQVCTGLGCAYPGQQRHPINRASRHRHRWLAQLWSARARARFMRRLVADQAAKFAGCAFKAFPKSRREIGRAVVTQLGADVGHGHLCFGQQLPGSPQPLLAQPAKDGQGALALTDLNNLFAGVKFYKAARGKGVKPILGAEVTVEGSPGQAAAQGQQSRLLLLVQNQQGYLNLCELLARAWTQSAQSLSAAVTWDTLAELGAGLIVLSGASAGLLGQALLAGLHQAARFGPAGSRRAA